MVLTVDRYLIKSLPDSKEYAATCLFKMYPQNRWNVNGLMQDLQHCPRFQAYNRPIIGWYWLIQKKLILLSYSSYLFRLCLLFKDSYLSIFNGKSHCCKTDLPDIRTTSSIPQNIKY